MPHPHALLLKFPGTNCDAESARALEAVGFSTEVLPITLLDSAALNRSQFVLFSGGFSYGDYVMSGRIAQLVTKQKIGDALQAFVHGGGYVMGICNGFQILTQLDLLPRGSLVHNASGRFICRWAGLKKNSASPYLQGLPDQFELPIAHAEGRFVGESGDADSYVQQGLAPLLYTEDVNGSSAHIAGLQDKSGRVFGLMPHPERFTARAQHYDPDWSTAEHGWGHYIFQSLRGAMA
jgi:phosphoribosylformylglycinamidine synthase subunit PurQ / glutaminase